MTIVRLVASAHDLASCLVLRRAVFIDEQGVPEADELDDLDASCHHFVAFDTINTADAVGTARMLLLDANTAKAQRVAVKHSHRRRGVGEALMRALHDHARALGCAHVELGSQVSALPFYRALGYLSEGPEFLDANIPHQKMHLALDVAR